MKVSLELMKMIVGDMHLPSADKIIKRIGSQLGAVEEAHNLKLVYQDALTVRVVSCHRLEGSDHLNVCTIDDKGLRHEVERLEDGLIQVVCGAPNVQAGQVVVWLPPGCIVPASADKDPLRLESRKIMGVISNGMIASAQELAVSNDHEGIVVLSDRTSYGEKLVDLLHLDDWVIDIENKMFTHRPDLFGQLGVAREISALFGRRFVSPEWYREDNKPKSKATGGIRVDNRLKDSSCTRFMAVSVGNLNVEPSPLWMQSYLSRCGIRPINNLVDITNFVMIVTGQPLHAYDLDKISIDHKAELVVRNGLENEKLLLLDGSEIILNSTDIVIANNEQALGLGGVMGGKGSEVDAGTKAIVLECANFDMYQIRKMAMSHGIFSEAVMRFSKGPSPWQCQPVLAYACNLLQQICPEAELISQVADSCSESLNRLVEVSVDITKLESYLGKKMPAEEVISLLGNTELVCRVEGEVLYVLPPFWRTDLSESVDIIEEVARLIGFDNLPTGLPERLINPPESIGLVKTKGAIRELLAASGANEILTYSFVDDKVLKSSSQDSTFAFKVSNALSPDLQYYRVSLTPSLLSKVHQNHKAGFERFVLFEIGKSHLVGVQDQEGLPAEQEVLSLVISANDKYAKSHSLGDAYYHARTYLDYLLNSLDIDTYSLSFAAPSSTLDAFWGQAAKPYQEGRFAVVTLGDHMIGLIGEYSASTRSNLKLPQFCAGFELNIEVIEQLIHNVPKSYKPLSRFPAIHQDLTINEHGEGFQNIYREISKNFSELAPKDVHVRIRPIDSYQAEGSAGVSWTFRVTAESDERTLTDDTVSTIIDRVTKL